MIKQSGFLPIVLAIAFLHGCATLPPGSNYPKKASLAMANPAQTEMGRQFEKAAYEHNGNSGFRIIPAGGEGFLVRMQMINAAVHTLDDRGVRVRLLIDGRIHRKSRHQKQLYLPTV